MRRAAVVGILMLLVGCTSTGASEKPTSTTTATAPDGQAMSASALRQLVLSPPAPFSQVPDDEKKTGLMEVGNPKSGVIGIAFATKESLVDNGFQRGWEKLFRTPDGAAVDSFVFEFDDPAGPEAIVAAFQKKDPPPGYTTTSLDGVPHAQVLTGTSPEGNATLATVFAHGRFLVGLVAGGPPGAHDYDALVHDLATAESTKLP